MATPTGTAPAGEVITVVGPAGEQRDRMLLALGRAGWATAVCERTDDVTEVPGAGPYVRRMVLLPRADGPPGPA